MPREVLDDESGLQLVGPFIEPLFLHKIDTTNRDTFSGHQIDHIERAVEWFDENNILEQ